jgi:hypothetical protein
LRANIPATAPPLDKPVFVTRPFFGIDNDSPLNDDDEEYYSEEDDDDLQEAIEQQEYDSGESASTIWENTLIRAPSSPSHLVTLYHIQRWTLALAHLYFHHAVCPNTKHQNLP